MKTDKKDYTNRILFVLAICGAVIAVYVTQSFIRQSPIVCVNSGCELVRKNPASYLFGIPVPAFGLVGYTLLAMLTFLRTTSESLHKKLLPWVLGIATGGVLFVGWFTYTELFVIKGICTWCAVSAVNMTVICVLAWKSYLLHKRSN
jgi:uncharacterized membrane protein